MPEKTDTSSNNGTAAGKKGGKIRGRVSILPEQCKGCGYCVEFCPLGVLTMADAFNAKGYHYPDIADAESCTGCDLCGMYCPDFAITGQRMPK